MSEPFFRLLLRAYPRTFQERFGDEMWLFFQDCLMEARTHRAKTLRLWLHTLIDIGITALREHRRQRRMNTTAFDNQIASSLDLWIKALRSGYSLKQIMDMMVKHAPEPTASAFQSAINELQNGIPLDRVFVNLADRVASDHWRLVQEALTRQFSEGGNLADRLEPVKEQIKANTGADSWSDNVPFGE